MNYKIVIKLDNEEIENNVVSLEQLNSIMHAFNQSINTTWKNRNIFVSIETTNEKALTSEEFLMDTFKRMIKVLLDDND